MEAETKENQSESPEENRAEQVETRPLSALRDLRPEKDPIGAGRGEFLGSRVKRP